MEKMMPISLFIKFIEEHLDGNMKQFGIMWLKQHGVMYHPDDEFPRKRETVGDSLLQTLGNDISQADQAWRGGLSNK
jgi:hypothetical protein